MVKQPSDTQLLQAANRFIAAMTRNAQAGADNLHFRDPKAYDRLVDHEFTAAERLVVMLLQYYSNQKMHSKALDAVAAQVREGF